MAPTILPVLIIVVYVLLAIIALHAITLAFGDALAIQWLVSGIIVMLIDRWGR